MNKIRVFIVAIVFFLILNSGFARSLTTVNVKNFKDKKEVERIIVASSHLPPIRRIEFISRYFLGRKYRPETKKRIKKQHSKKVVKTEADNKLPLPVKRLRTSLKYLDCMTYVEHVLALSSCKKPSYSEFLNRLIDIMFDANGQPLMNHMRSHFTSHWGDVLEKKGYVYNYARNHPMAKLRNVVLNKVGKNRTYYVKDRFMISKKPQKVWYFPKKVVLEHKAGLKSGDIIALTTNKEGLDVTHMAFFIIRNGKRLMRNASYTLNKVVDQDIDKYLNKRKSVTGIMVFRPILKAKKPISYSFKKELKNN